MTQPRYTISVLDAEGNEVFKGGSDLMFLRKDEGRPGLCVVVAEELMSFAHEPQPALATTVSSNERAAFFADKHRHLLSEIEQYENTHPDDAPCLDGATVTIDSKAVILHTRETRIH